MIVKTTSLNGNLDKGVYMVQSTGFVEVGKEHLVCYLNKQFMHSSKLRDNGI